MSNLYLYEMGWMRSRTSKMHYLNIEKKRNIKYTRIKCLGVAILGRIYISAPWIVTDGFGTGPTIVLTQLRTH